MTPFGAIKRLRSDNGGEYTSKLFEKLIKLSYIFLAKQEISEAYTNVPAKTHVNYFISMSVRIRSVC